MGSEGQLFKVCDWLQAICCCMVILCKVSDGQRAFSLAFWLIPQATVPV